MRNCANGKGNLVTSEKRSKETVSFSQNRFICKADGFWNLLDLKKAVDAGILQGWKIIWSYEQM